MEKNVLYNGHLLPKPIYSTSIYLNWTKQAKHFENNKNLIQTEEYKFYTFV